MSQRSSLAAMARGSNGRRLKRAAAAAAAAAATPSAAPARPPAGDEFPVTVYRLVRGGPGPEKRRGGAAEVRWERYRPSLSAAGGAPVTAVPREGCVEVRAMRLRIRLFGTSRPPAPPAGTGTGTGTGTYKPPPAVPADATSSSALVVRRSASLLLSSRLYLGAVVLRFRSVADCLGFSDLLMERNAGLALRGGGSGGDLRAWEGAGGACGADPRRSRPDAASHLVRLLQDPAFLDLVDRVERTVVDGVEGGEDLLRAMALPGAASAAADAASSVSLVAMAAGGG